ncbi:gametocyte-specific factor 1 [Parambassis ranga]|uniref:Gametocyte-specific factor 1 n=1 Tax=Parambassis ranga TaxID=210632 RepID=A0A6P7IN68_9TELE|nr:gametocyte-specific factor 1-like [Parambassis ranga]
MTTFRFGTSPGPCRIGAEPQLQDQMDADEQADLDPESLQQCPFDKNHKIRACRFPYHLIKCRKNHPKLASELKTCPYNARHLVPKHELAYHMETCKNRKSVDGGDAEKTSGHIRPLPVSTWVNPNVTEDWDHESSDAAAPFIWGITTNAAERLGPQPTNMHYSPLCRAPENLPWSSEEP